MRLVTTNPMVALAYNAGPGLFLLCVFLLFIAPPLVIPGVILLKLLTVFVHARIHPLFIILAMLGSLLVMVKAFNAFLRALPVRLGAGIVCAYVAACYGVASFHSLDMIWWTAWVAFTGWMGWKIGLWLASRQHLKLAARREATASVHAAALQN